MIFFFTGLVLGKINDRNKQKIDELKVENQDKAKSFCDKLKEILKKEEEVVLDFAGIQATTLVFLFVLFTNLWNEYGKDLKNKLTIKNGSQGLFKQMIYLKENYKELKSKFLGVHQNFEIAYIG